MDPITVEIMVLVPPVKAWEVWTSPEHIPNWAFASDDWEAVNPESDLQVGGKFKTTMQAKDGSNGFDFSGSYTVVEEPEILEYVLDDGRKVRVEFTPVPDGTQILQTFDPENENDIEFQKQGWQAFLNNYKKYAEQV